MEAPLPRPSPSTEIPLTFEQDPSRSSRPSIEQYGRPNKIWQDQPPGLAPSLGGRHEPGPMSHEEPRGSLRWDDRVRRLHERLPFISPVQSSTERSVAAPNHHVAVDQGILAEDDNVDQPVDRAQAHGAGSMGSTSGKYWSINDGHHFSGRANDGQVEKNVTATMSNNTESNARSRKASHSLGLFKENAAAQEKTKRQSRSSDRLPTGGAPLRRKDTVEGATLSEGAERPKPASRPSKDDAVPERPLSDLRSPTASSHTSEKGGRPWEAEKSLPEPAIREVSKKVVDSLSPSDHRSSSMPETPRLSSLGRTQVIETEEPAVDDLQTRSLDETYPQQRIGSRLGQGVSSSRSNSTDLVQPLEASVPITDISSRPLETEDDPHGPSVSHQDADAEAVDEGEDDSSDKDEISSALYFPHHTTPMQVMEEVSSCDDAVGESAHDNQLLPGSNLADGKQSFAGLTHSATLPEDVLWASKEGPHHHTSYVSEPDSVASESEYESYDDAVGLRKAARSSSPDNVDLTPTATPRSHVSILPHRPSKAETLAALGAVELKPYNHQVGGHTTVFRFSRRAVCKSLSNRENEFYETIERRHPELLGFLPRFVILPAVPP